MRRQGRRRRRYRRRSNDESVIVSVDPGLAVVDVEAWWV